MRAKRRAEPAPVVPATLDPLDRRRQAAEDRVREALSCLEQAQGLISRAATALCSVSEMETTSRVVWGYYDRLLMVSTGIDRKSGALRVNGRLILDYTPPVSPAPEGGER